MKGRSAQTPSQEFQFKFSGTGSVRSGFGSGSPQDFGHQEWTSLILPITPDWISPVR